MAHGPLPGAGETPAEAAEESYHTGKVIGLAVVAALGGFLFGYDSAVVNGAVAGIESVFEVSSALIGIVVAIALLGSAVGAWFAGSLANRFGRRRVMIIAAVLFFVAAIGQGLPVGLWDLMFWRVVGGAGIGVASVIAPMYIAEIAPAQLRGRLGSLQQLAIVSGIFASALMNYFILNAATKSAEVAANPESRTAWLFGLEAWQWMFLVMVVPALVYGILAMRIPESPRYLVSVGRDEEAAEVLQTIYTDDQHEKVAQIKATMDLDEKPNFRQLLGNRLGLQPIVWVGILLSVFQQFVGINVIFYYSNTIWSAVGFDESQAFLVTLITNTTNVVVTLVAISLVDRIGRKPLLLVGSIGMAVTLGLMAYIFGTAAECTQALLEQGGVAGCTTAEQVAAAAPVLTGAAGPMAVIAANLYVVFFGVSWGPVVWVLLGEMFPNSIRAAALAVAAAAQWVANFVVSVSFPPLASFSLGFAYMLYATFALVSFFFVLKVVRETKGRTLEELSSAAGA